MRKGLRLRIVRKDLIPSILVLLEADMSYLIILMFSDGWNNRSFVLKHIRIIYMNI